MATIQTHRTNQFAIVFVYLLCILQVVVGYASLPNGQSYANREILATAKEQDTDSDGASLQLSNNGAKLQNEPINKGTKKGRTLSSVLKTVTNSGSGSVSDTAKANADSPNMVSVSQYLRSRHKRDVSNTGSQDIEAASKDIAYYVELNLGQPSQTFNLIVDTGSFYTWVYGWQCTASACTSHNQYNPNKSSSSKEDTAADGFTISYTGSTIQGNVYEDQASIAGFFTDLDFGVASQSGNSFAAFNVDGIMGLPANEYKANTFPSIVTTLKNNGLIDSRVFGVNLGRYNDPGDQGSIMFGGIDTTKYVGDINYMDIQANQLLWSVPVGTVTVNNQQVSFSGGQQRKGIFDTGTTLLVMPQADALALHNEIEGAITDGSSFAIPCDSDVTVNIQFGGQNYALTSSDFIGSPTQSDSSMCATNVQGMTLQDAYTWVIGDTFLKTVYTVFDMDNQQIGLAEKKQTDTSSTSSDSSSNGGSSTSSSTSSSSSNGNGNGSSSQNGGQTSQQDGSSTSANKGASVSNASSDATSENVSSVETALSRETSVPTQLPANVSAASASSTAKSSTTRHSKSNSGSKDLAISLVAPLAAFLIFICTF